MKSYGIMSIVIFCVIFIIIIILISNGISSPGEMGDSGTIGCIGLGFDEMFYTFQDLSSILTQTDAAIGEDERGVFTPPAYASTTKASDKYPFSPYELFGDIVRPPYFSFKKIGTYIINIQIQYTLDASLQRNISIGIGDERARIMSFPLITLVPSTAGNTRSRSINMVFYSEGLIGARQLFLRWKSEGDDIALDSHILNFSVRFLGQ